MGEDEKIAEQLRQLMEEHSSLDMAIDALRSQRMEQLNMQRLKRRKLWLKDEISRLRSILHPDLTA